jgi:RimJ/RimL family protein N-acetyltransferase
MDSDCEVRRHLHPNFLNDFDPEEHRQLLLNRVRTVFGPGLGYWAIERRDDPGVFCGWIELIPLADEGPDIEIGWRLRRSYWGYGFATEAARAILRHGFIDLRLGQIVAVIDPNNHRSREVAGRLGLRPAGQTRAYSLDLDLYVLTAAEFTRRGCYPEA